MLRKDVKIGLGIGGGLLGVLIVYLLITSAPPQQDEVTLAPDQNSSQTSGGATDATGSGGAGAASTTTPRDSTVSRGDVADPFGAAERPGSAAAQPAGAKDAPATGPIDPWQAALNTGKLETAPPQLWVTETPAGPSDPPAPSGPDQTAPAAPPANAPDGAAGASSASSEPAGLPMGGSNPATRPTGRRSHVVQPNENFSTIAQAVYGSSAYWPHLVRANPNVDPKKLRPGMTINIPDPSEVVARATNEMQTPHPAAASPVPAGATVAPAATIDPSREYRVQMNDSLYKISLKLYGRADKLDAIYQLNKDAIGPNPSALKVGMILKLPEPPTRTAAR